MNKIQPNKPGRPLSPGNSDHNKSRGNPHDFVSPGSRRENAGAQLTRQYNATLSLILRSNLTEDLEAQNRRKREKENTERRGESLKNSDYSSNSENRSKQTNNSDNPNLRRSREAEQPSQSQKNENHSHSRKNENNGQSPKPENSNQTQRNSDQTQKFENKSQKFDNNGQSQKTENRGQSQKFEDKTQTQSQKFDNYGQNKKTDIPSADKNHPAESRNNESPQNMKSKELPQNRSNSENHSSHTEKNHPEHPENSRSENARQNPPRTDNKSVNSYQNVPMNEQNQPKNQNILKQPPTTPWQSGQSARPAPQENLPELVNRTLNSLINAAKDHPAFTQLRDKPESFWNNVRQMSEITIVEKYVNGKFVPQAVSRFGELLEKMNRCGESLQTFITRLPAAERDVFVARYQLSKIFGANELFVGNGVMLNKDGNFSVRVFMANGGNLDLPLNMILSLTSGGLPFDEIPAALFLANPNLVLDMKTAALLSMSLSLYQNIGSQIPLDSLLPEMFLPNLQKAGEQGAAHHVDTALNDKPVNTAVRLNEFMIPVALINGGLKAFENMLNENENFTVEEREARFSIYHSGFSAGATGAMMGAVVGCIVSLEQERISSALGFAASLVTGTAERGLRALSADLLVSDVITAGVSIMLESAPSLLLTEGDQNEFISPDTFDTRIPAMSF